MTASGGAIASSGVRDRIASTGVRDRIDRNVLGLTAGLIAARQLDGMTKAQPTVATVTLTGDPVTPRSLVDRGARAIARIVRRVARPPAGSPRVAALDGHPARQAHVHKAHVHKAHVHKAHVRKASALSVRRVSALIGSGLTWIGRRGRREG